MFSFKKIIPVIMKDPWTYVGLIGAVLVAVMPVLLTDSSRMHGMGSDLGWIGIGILMIGFFALRVAFFFYGRYRMIIDTPTSCIESASMGRAEIKGTVECDEPLTSPLAGEKCGYYSVTVRNVARNNSAPILEVSDASSILLSDKTGTARVNLDEAFVRTAPVFVDDDTTINDLPDPYRDALGERLDCFEREDGRWVEPGLLSDEPGSDLRVRVYRLDAGADAYAIGRAVPAEDESIAVTTDTASGALIVSNQSEDDLAGRYARSGLYVGLIGAAAMVLGLYTTLVFLTPLL